MGLSGGQRQRVSLARSIYPDPSILILDEATSGLDAHSEAEVIGRLLRENQGKTILIIAHRLSTVRYADRVLVMDNGKIVEEGSHDELMLKGKYYADLFAAQFSAHQGATA
jgi:ABC-type multidrug transport system fused ATPase/permease subunit